jgi:signal transduction histidine kinase/ABC-type multidrug transport system ATPase subunit
VLEVADVTVNFGAMAALTGINLRVGPGEILGLTGEPGAGKTAIVRCVAGDLTPSSGEVRVDGVSVSGGLRGAERAGVAVVWQDLALCETLDVATNLLLGHETLLQILSPARFHTRAEHVLEELGIPIQDTTQLVSKLSGGQRRLLAMAMAMIREPRVLVLDEPTLSLGTAETSEVEQLLVRMRVQGTAILLAGRDIDQMFRIADRIAVLRNGRVVTELEPGDSHPDDVAALLAGGTVSGSARRQLIRLHGLADSLALADPSSGLTLIISALAAALGVDRGRIDVVHVPVTAESTESVIVEGRTWLVPVVGPAGTSAMITIARDAIDAPNRDELDLLGLYAGYAAAAIERQEAETAQLEAAALRRSRELQRQFLSRLSHELRTPLTAIRGYASSLLAPDIVWDDDSEQRFLERITAESARLGRLVDDLLDFSAIESGVMRMQLDWCELGLVMEAAIACLPDEWPTAVQIVGDAPMPIIWADHDRLEQVFVNLLSNALHHNPPGTRVSVAVRTIEDGDVQITVRDDGHGLPQALQGSPFESNGRPRTPTSGAGLGLSITRGIVEAHHGKITVDSSSKGTAFTIVLPVESAAGAPDQLHPPPMAQVRDDG